MTTLLCGCNSFAWSDDDDLTSIEKIEKIVDSEGNAFIEIHYTNSDKIDKFPLPEGNGIQSIDYEDNEEERVTVVTITYTNGNTTVVNIPYGKDGEDGSSMNMVILDKNLAGDPILKFYEEAPDGTLTEKGSINIKELRGKDGLGFKSFEYISDDIGYGVKIALTGEAEPTTYYFNYKKDISVELVGDEYVIMINSTNPDEQASIFYLTRMPGWLQGDDYPQKTLGIAGDFYFDTYHEIIYTKVGEDEFNPSVGNWVVVAELSTRKNALFTVTFDAGNGTIPGYDEHKTIDQNSNVYELNNIPYNSYFYDKYGTIPVPEQEGFRFVGWYRSLTPTINEAPFNDFVLITSDITLIARWEKIE